MQKLSSLKTSFCALFVRAGRHIHRFFSLLGPRRVLILFASLIAIQVGSGVFAGYSGKPADAPHLLIPEDYRSLLWVGFAVISIFFILVKKKMKFDKYAILLLAVMPLLRLVSYLLSWILSWDFLMDALFNDTVGFQGSPSAWYSCFPAILQLLLLVAASYAPVRWSTVTAYLIEEIKTEKSTTTEGFKKKDTDVANTYLSMQKRE